MSKFTVEYTRVIRLAKYETLKIGLIQEFETDELPEEYAFNQVKDAVNSWIGKEKEWFGVKNAR